MDISHENEELNEPQHWVVNFINVCVHALLQQAHFKVPHTPHTHTPPGAPLSPRMFYACNEYIFQACTTAGHSWTVEFLQDFGDVPLLVSGVSKLTHSTTGMAASLDVSPQVTNQGIARRGRLSRGWVARSAFRYNPIVNVEIGRVDGLIRAMSVISSEESERVEEGIAQNRAGKKKMK